MATIGHALHFSYSEMLDMEIDDFLDFAEKAKKILEREM